MVIVLVEGGLSSLNHAVQAVLNGMSVIVGDGSGRAADLLAKATYTCRKIALVTDIVLDEL